jgi:GntR family transcriptional regulator/MocR family aminotransferase
MGQLTAGTRLPSTRGLARELGVARNTVMLAYGLQYDQERVQPQA